MVITTNAGSKTTFGKGLLVHTRFCFGASVRHRVILLEQLCGYLNNFSKMIFFNYSTNIDWQFVGVPEQNL